MSRLLLLLAAPQRPAERTPRRRAVPPLIGAGLVLRRVHVQARDVVFLKGVLEAHDGLAVVFSERGGDLTIATTFGQESELDSALRDLASELEGMLLDSVSPSDDFRDQQNAVG